MTLIGSLGKRSVGPGGTVRRRMGAEGKDASGLEQYLPDAPDPPEGLVEFLAALDAEMAGFLRSGKTREYNRLVPEYNRMARAYNDVAGSYNALREDVQAAVDLHNHLVTHAHDRPGSYLVAREYLTG